LPSARNMSLFLAFGKVKKGFKYRGKGQGEGKEEEEEKKRDPLEVNVASDGARKFQSRPGRPRAWTPPLLVTWSTRRSSSPPSKPHHEDITVADGNKTRVTHKGLAVLQREVPLESVQNRAV